MDRRDVAAGRVSGRRVHERAAPAAFGRGAAQSPEAGGLGNYYWIYFQTPGVAEAEFERDVSATLRKLLYGVSGDAPIDRENPLVIPEGQGFLDRLVVPAATPAWLREEDVAKMVGEYQRTGFRGGLNWYRNIDRNWELTAAWRNATIHATRTLHRRHARPRRLRVNAVKPPSSTWPASFLG